jgi:hypothetical protein
VGGSGTEQAPCFHFPDDGTAGKNSPYQSGQQKLHSHAGAFRAKQGGACWAARSVGAEEKGDDQENQIAHADTHRKANGTAEQDLFFHRENLL